MKNKNIPSLKKEVPVKIRLEVYREAVAVIESNKYIAGLNSFGICLILPCLLWGLEDYLQEAPNGEYWTYSDVPIAFPEITRRKIENIQLRGRGEAERKDTRLEYLREVVEKCESLLNINQ